MDADNLNKYLVYLTETIVVEVKANYVYHGSSLVSFYVKTDDNKSECVGEFYTDNIKGFVKL